MRQAILMAVTVALVAACSPAVVQTLSTATPAVPRPRPSETPLPRTTPSSTVTAPPTERASPSPVATVAQLRASVTADLLSCRYGPGPDYLYLYGLRKGANIVLIGKTDQDNWHWAYVQGKSKCWVNLNFVNVEGDWRTLPVVYPGIARLPVSPYYPPTSVLSVVRKNDQITVEWLDIPLRAGDEEDASMQRYIVEVWRCENGRLMFEPLATNDLSVTFTDQSGCNIPSHGRIFVQEKHGFSGPTDIPWPAIP